MSLSEQFLAAIGTEQSDRLGYMCKKCFSMFERYLWIKEALLNTIHATILAPASAIPSTPIDVSHGDPSRKRPAEDDSANSAKRCRLGEQPVPLQHLNPTGGKPFLAHYQFVLSPRMGHQLLWSWFINVHGKPWRNIPCDLHMEHLNRVLKNGVQNLNANKTEKVITCLGKCVGTVAQVLRTYDEEHNVGMKSSHHKAASSDKDLQQLVTELVVNIPFTEMKGRKLKRFKLKTTLIKRRCDENMDEGQMAGTPCWTSLIMQID